MESKARKKNRARQINSSLKKLYPNAHCALKYNSPLELLIATILSAQCTDARVNMVTPALFKRFKTAKNFADASQEEVEDIIRSTGFYRNKAKNIIACCKKIVEDHGGNVPDSMDELVPLPGVGRKTANVVLGNAFGKPGLPVDTHVGRLSRRLGLSENSDPVKVEYDIHELVPAEEWTMLGHRLIEHGRQVCESRKPDCDSCQIADLCPRIGISPSNPKSTSRKKKS